MGRRVHFQQFRFGQVGQAQPCSEEEGVGLALSSSAHGRNPENLVQRAADDITAGVTLLIPALERRAYTMNAADQVILVIMGYSCTGTQECCETSPSCTQRATETPAEAPLHGKGMLQQYAAH